MKNNLTLALFSTIAICIFSINTAIANEKYKCPFQDGYDLYSTTVNSVHINCNNKQPKLAKTGGNFTIPAGKTSILKGEILVGEKNDDSNFQLQHYATFEVPKNSTLELYGKLLIQRDGMLINNGKITLHEDSSLLAPSIQYVDRKDKSKLQYRIYNKNGIIVIKNGSNTYWREISKNSETMFRTTIYKGTIDFRDILNNISNIHHFTGTLYLNLEKVKIILFDSSVKDIDMSKFSNIEIFKNIYLGKECEIDGIFDFQKPVSNVTRIQKDIMKNNIKLLQGTIVRTHSKFGSAQENTIRNLFGNGNKLKINAKQYSEEKINYPIKKLLEEFNDPKKINIINTNYTDLFNSEYHCNHLNKELTNDWNITIDKNIFPLYSNLFLQNNNKSIHRYNMYFSFEGNKNISFVLQDEQPVNNYQIAFYRSFRNYHALLNEKLSDTNSNVVNNFVQKYSGLSPYLKTNSKTVYKISTNDNEQNCVILRF